MDLQLVTPETAAAILRLPDDGLEELTRASKLTLISIRGKRRYMRQEVQALAMLEHAA